MDLSSPNGPIRQLGAALIAYTEACGMMVFFSLRVSASCVSYPPPRLRAVLEQIHFIGARSMLVICVSGVFTGMIIALQFHQTLVRFGSADMLGSAVALALLRELGPVMTALMVIARAGSALCAEIGIMRIDEQFDAMECMAIDPYKYLFAPRLLGALFSVPLLVAIFDVIGIAGGYLVGVFVFGVSEGAFLQGMSDSVVWDDVKMGLVKSLVFGVLIVCLVMSKGFFMHLRQSGAYGAEGVSRTTTEAVVLSAIAVLFADYLLSALMISDE